jgi:hypothetical protein
VLQTQTRDIERLSLATIGLSSRLSAAHRLAGESALESMRLPRAYNNLSPTSAPSSAPDLYEVGRSPIDFRALDGLGTPLVAGQGPAANVLSSWVDFGTSNSNSNAPVASYAAPTPQSAALFNNRSAPTSLAAPSSLSAPPSSLAAPPSFGAPPPPPSFGLPGGLPPPPPPPPPGMTGKNSCLLS